MKKSVLHDAEQLPEKHVDFFSVANNITSTFVCIGTQIK